MTEMAPLGSVAHYSPAHAEASDEVKFAYRAKQGTAGAFVDIRRATRTASCHGRQTNGRAQRSADSGSPARIQPPDSAEVQPTMDGS